MNFDDEKFPDCEQLNDFLSLHLHFRDCQPFGLQTAQALKRSVLCSRTLTGALQPSVEPVKGFGLHPALRRSLFKEVVCMGVPCKERKRACRL
jgi:hypothetical protein